MQSQKDKEANNIFIRVMKIDQFIQFFKFLRAFSVKGSNWVMKQLATRAKDLLGLFSDTKKILILSRFSFKDTLSFTEIQRDLDISSSLLSYDLRKMTELGFLEKKYSEEREDKKFSYYSLTDLGRKIISQIFTR
jgi:DNA-binding HxlR family transcriptional regulator